MAGSDDAPELTFTEHEQLMIDRQLALEESLAEDAARTVTLITS